MRGGFVFCTWFPTASVAQSAEHRIRNAGVGGSSPPVGCFSAHHETGHGLYTVAQNFVYSRSRFFK